MLTDWLTRSIFSLRVWMFSDLPFLFQSPEFLTSTVIIQTNCNNKNSPKNDLAKIIRKGKNIFFRNVRYKAVRRIEISSYKKSGAALWVKLTMTTIFFVSVLYASLITKHKIWTLKFNILNDVIYLASRERTRDNSNNNEVN